MPSLDLATLAERPQLYINGQYVDATDDERLPSVDPATGLEWTTIPHASAADVDAAVSAAADALKGPWGSMAPAARGTYLLKLAELIDELAEQLAPLETHDNGKALRESLGEMAGCSMWYRYYAGLADKITGRTINTQPGFHVYTRREPIGVVGAILPWNSPLMTVAWKLGPALATGNTLVLKPAESTSVTGLLLGALLTEIGLPSGVVNIVSGLGRTTGAALVRHPLVNKISFTGSTRTGVAILRDAAVAMKKVSLELGGKSPHIIFDDADLAAAAVVAASGVFSAAGQTCVAGSRVFVHRAVYDEFLKLFVETAETIRVGDPKQMKTHMGAIVSTEQFDKIVGFVEDARKDGATVLTGGQPLTVRGCEGGHFYPPTVLSNVRPTSRAAVEEIFGPVVVVFPFDTEEEVIERANDTVYGLSAGVWTSDLKRSYRIAAALQAGTVWINGYRRLHASVPFGGYKMSGLGRESGEEVLDLYTQVKAVWVSLQETVDNPYTSDRPTGPAIG